MKPVVYLHREPHVIWDEEEVDQMIVKENLQFAIIVKFSYGWHDNQDLRRIIPKQCDLKGDCNIWVLRSRHILSMTSNMDDYINLLSKPAFYISHKNWTYIMRTFKWDALFNLEEETTMAIIWILFPTLPLIIFFWERVSFLLSNYSWKTPTGQSSHD